MSRVSSINLRLMVTAVLMTMTGLLGVVSAKDGADPTVAALKSHLKEARKDETIRNSIRIEVEGNLDAGMHRLTIFGRGIGIWNGERQFSLTSQEVVSAIDLVLRAKFCNMPDRFAYEEAEDERPMPIKMMRMIKVTAEDLSKTVIQDNKGPRSEPFAKLTADLIALCRKPAETGLTARSLADGLHKVADGALAPETLLISVNAPQLRSLESQDGQGWLLTLKDGRLSLRSNILDQGIQDVGVRPLTAREVQALAKNLLDAGVADLPQNVNTTGYTHITVAVLDHRVQTLARRYATAPGKAAKAAEKSFAGIRADLYALFESETGK